ncbi:hypothetical protein [Borborobacter arsenicus]|uniref:hypothetical protein n=1 Tax=Borborobacter arsenicus TaxID=1851146 RepID=UPI003CCAF70D
MKYRSATPRCLRRSVRHSPWLPSFLAEIPPAANLFGGTIVLAAVFSHAGRDWNEGSTATHGLMR